MMTGRRTTNLFVWLRVKYRIIEKVVCPNAKDAFMTATHCGQVELAYAILKTYHDGLCSKDDAKLVLLCLLRSYSDPSRVIAGRPQFDIHVSRAALATSAPKHREHAVPLDHIATMMLAEAKAGGGSPTAALLNIPYSLAQVVMLETEHATLNKTKSLKQGMPANWNGNDRFARYSGLPNFEFSGATLEQARELQKAINLAEGRERAKRTREAKRSLKK